ncbi:glycosyltransferase family 4 protein [Candidatus Solincola sp.]
MRIAAVRADMSIKAGAQAAFIRMMRELYKKGHEIDIYLLSCSEDLRRELESIARVKCFLNHKRHMKSILAGIKCLLERWEAFPIIRDMAVDIRNGSYDLVFVDHYHLATMIFPLLGKMKKVYYCYEPPRRYYDSPLIRRDFPSQLKYIFNYPFYRVDMAIDRWLARQADLILTNSDFTRECVWKAYGLFARTVYLGVDSEEHRPLPGMEKEDFVLTVGVVQAHKGHDFVVRSLSLIPKDVRPRLVIVYYDKDERLFRELKRSAEELGVELELKSFVNDREFARLHSSARFVVLGFIMEPSLEPVAFAYKLPIVAVREGGVREVVRHGITGFLTDRDEREFAAAVERLLRNPKEAETMGERARKWVEENFTWEACGERLEKCLEDLLHS